MAKKGLLTLLAVLGLFVAAAGGASGQEPESEYATAENVTEAQTDAETEADSMITGGGSPWIDSDLKENITDDMELSEKEDFHLAVNHEWLSQNEIADGRSSNSKFLEVERQTMENTKKLLTDDSLTGEEAGLVHSFYHAWLDWDARNEDGVGPIRQTVEEIQDIQTIDELSDFICSLDGTLYIRDNGYGYGTGFFVTLKNSSDLNDATSYITEIFTDGFTLDDPAEYSGRTEQGDRYYEAYKYAAAEMLSRFGIEKDEADAMFDDMIALEGKIAEKAMTSEDYMAADMYERINNVMTTEELKSLTVNFPLYQIVSAAGYTDTDQYLVYEPELFGRIDELYTQENLETLKSYVLLHFLFHSMQYLDRDAYETYIACENIKYGSEGSKTDEEYAYQDTKTYLRDPLGKLYVQTYSSAEMKQRITEICEEAVSYYRTMLEEEDWLSDETKQKAIEKLDNLAIHAVYPEKWSDYSGLELDGLSYYEMIRSIVKFGQAGDAARTGQKVDRELWDMDILAANAYYNPQDNSINILQGILGGNFYYDGISQEALLGGIGVVIGHEISHAFDTNGAQFDKDGNLSNWWTDEDLASFQERADKLAAYYDTIIPFEGETVRGSNIKTEAIADMTGVKCMLAIAEGQGSFDYDTFFRAYAGIWARLNTREYEYYLLTQDTHPLHYLRTNVTLQQFDRFLETYGITEGDGMYLAPEERVLVW